MQVYFEDLFSILKDDVTIRIFDTDGSMICSRIKKGFTSVMYSQFKLDSFKLKHIAGTYVDLEIC